MAPPEPRIQVLPGTLVNQIAAGAVVERPASVVKELVENALDAGATRIAIEAEGGGVSRLSITDDGSGMTPGDARLAFERHATSKIRTLDDLARIGTLGFRGEALPSIASVSVFRLTTSPDTSGLGTEVVVDRGAEPRVSATRHPKGTRVVVEDLFGNVPARRKFLRSAEGEMRAVVRTATTLALARPDVAFTLRSGLRTLFDLPPVADAASRFRELLGEDRVGELLPVSWSGLGMTLTGAVTSPDVTFPTRQHQLFYVNGRAARDQSVQHAATVAARELLMSDRFPAFVLFLTCDPAVCDVNVHPQKLEVRFRDPGTVHSAVHRALARALGAGKSATAVGGDALRSPGSRPLFPVSYDPRLPAASAMAEAIGVFERSPSLVSPDAVTVSRSAYAEGGVRPSTPVPSPLGPLRLLGQYRASYLLAEGDGGLVLVDQHVAHERVRFERIRQRLLEREPASQPFLLPVAFEATPEEAVTLRQSEALLLLAGFVVSETSGRGFLVSSAPPECGAGAVVPFLRDFLARLAELPAGEASVSAERRDALAASLACRGAITINTPLSHEEAVRLLTDLARCEDPYTCPHGRPILLTLEHGELEKRFGRSRRPQEVPSIVGSR